MSDSPETKEQQISVTVPHSSLSLLTLSPPPPVACGCWEGIAPRRSDSALRLGIVKFIIPIIESYCYHSTHLNFAIFREIIPKQKISSNSLCTKNHWTSCSTSTLFTMSCYQFDIFISLFHAHYLAPLTLQPSICSKLSIQSPPHLLSNSMPSLFCSNFVLTILSALLAVARIPRYLPNSWLEGNYWLGDNNNNN